jgi:hypothetical protein
MRFEHLIEINSPSVAAQTVVPPFTREQLWHGLMARVLTPQRFPLGPDSCDWREVEPGVIQRTVRFGANAMKDEVQADAFQRLEFTPEPHGDTTPIRLTITIEEPQPGRMVLRFLYESVSELSAEEAYFNDYRHNAWLHNDRDMVRTLRQWLSDEGL